VESQRSVCVENMRRTTTPLLVMNNTTLKIFNVEFEKLNNNSMEADILMMTNNL